jgi:formamidopyrimidine-DNA glycosylase
MPELPEVETVRQTLRRKLIGKTIVDVEVLYPNIIKHDLEIFRESIKNQTILEVDRLGKYLLIRLSDFYLISHLRMEGKYFLRPVGLERDKHDHIIFHFSDGTELRYHDVRKFGTMHLKGIEEVYKGEPLEKMGYEPFDDRFTLEYMKKQFLHRKSPIKNVLLDQTIIAGLGNIYVNEVLFISKIHPERLANTLNEGDLQNIKDASIRVLRKAIELGGTTIRSYYSDDAITGLFQNELLVHQKKGEPCPNCKTPIEKIKVGGRGTYICPKCQPLS